MIQETLSAETSGRASKCVAWFHIPYVGYVEADSFAPRAGAKRFRYVRMECGGYVLMVGRLRVEFNRCSTSGIENEGWLNDAWNAVRGFCEQAVGAILFPFKALPLVLARRK